MIKQVIYIILMLTGVINPYTFQNSTLGNSSLNKAIFYFKQKKLNDAIIWIDKAANVNPEDPKTLYYKGFFYKELFKRNKASNNRSEYRETSIKALMEAKNIGVPINFKNSLLKSLQYLSTTYFQEAVSLLNENHLEKAKKTFDKAKTLTKKLNKYDNTFQLRELDFLLLCASKYDLVISQGEVLDSNQLVQVRAIYDDALKINPNSGPTNYNLALLYYNNAVNIITNLDYNYPLEELLRIQDYCVNNLFLESLPFMLKSYQLKYQEVQTILGLQGIYFSINDMNNFEKFKKLYEQKINNSSE